MLANLCREILEEIGEDPNREGLQQTPERFARAMADLTVGYNQTLDELVKEAVFAEKYDEMVVVKRIEFYSLCEHHLLPFFGFAHVAYIPDGKIIGLSKIPRIVNMFSRRLQVQERLTEQIATALDELLQPRGVACMIQAGHMCMRMRGVQSQSGYMVTNSMKGDFLNNQSTRAEFMSIVSGEKL